MEVYKMNNQFREFKYRFLFARQRAGITTSDLARFSGQPLQLISDLETGNIDDPPAKAAYQFAQVLRVDREWLIFGTDKMSLEDKIKALQGKYAYVKTSSEEFSRRKRHEYEHEEIPQNAHL
jgi:transcriptional regulator with XRE-family HTH domain